MRLVFFFVVSSLALGCGAAVYPVEGRFKTVPFDGELQVDQSDTSRRFVLALRGVPEPWRLSPAARVYVAWLISERRGAARLARVTFDDLARSLSFDEPSPEEGSRVRVTAEAESWVGEPSEAVLFERQVEPWRPHPQ